MAGVRVTVAVARVLREFLGDPSQPLYGYELMRRTGFPSGKLYPILVRLVQAGWLVREHEDVGAAVSGGPARRMYRLSPEGTRAARLELAALNAQIAPATPMTLRPRPEGPTA